MQIVLGVSATSADVTAALVDVDLPRLGPLDERISSIESGALAGVGDAVAAAIGVMKLRAVRNELAVTSTAVVYETAAQRDSITRALAGHQIDHVNLVDAQDLDSPWPRPVAVAVWSHGQFGVAEIPVPEHVPAQVNDEEPDRRGLALVAGGIAAAVVAGAVAVWAVAGTEPPENAGASAPLESSVSEVASSSVPSAVLQPALAVPPAPLPASLPDATDVPAAVVDGAVTYDPAPVPGSSAVSAPVVRRPLVANSTVPTVAATDPADQTTTPPRNNPGPTRGPVTTTLPSTEPSTPPPGPTTSTPQPETSQPETSQPEAPQPDTP